MPIIAQIEKQPRDPVLIKFLVNNNVDSSGVELVKVKNYAKEYVDLNSNKHFQTISQLPNLNHLGETADAGWLSSGNTFISKTNLFEASVFCTDVILTCINDQPNGAKTGDFVSWSPRLSLDGVEQYSNESILLLTDPCNDNYHQNVIEWDYGICKRILRIIEGMLLERWIFTDNPNGEVEINYNQTGKLKLKLGSAWSHGMLINVATPNDDTEIISKETFDTSIYPVEIADSQTFYPDATPGAETVDGKAFQTYNFGSGVDWSVIRSDTGNYADDDANYGVGAWIWADSVQDKWHTIYRGIFLFNTSDLEGIEIDSATLSLLGYDVEDNLAIGMDINIYSSDPVSNTSLTGADYSTLGSSAFSDAIVCNDWGYGEWNDFVLNASGIAAINKTGISKFGTRNANYDVAGIVPTWSSMEASFMECNYIEQGIDKSPKLVVQWTSTGWTGKMMGVTNPAKIMGVEVADIKSVNGVE